MSVHEYPAGGLTMRATRRGYRPVFVGAWEKVRTEGQCRFCQRPWEVRPATRHHLVPQTWFKTKEGAAKRNMMNSGRNVIGLCRVCHDRVDCKDEEERMQARRELRKLMTQAEIAFAIELRGPKWLNLNYPLLPQDPGATVRESQAA